MEYTRKQYMWSVLLFGTLIGLNETIIGSFHIQFKSVVLSAITLSLFAYARYHIPRFGSTMLITLVALLYKLTSLGIQFCKPTMVLLLGLGFELFAYLFINRKKLSYLGFILTCAVTSIVTFTGFALLETYIVKNEYWISEKFNDYVFIKAPLTAVVSAILTVLGVFIIKKLNPELINSLFRKPVISQIILGLFIFALWVAGYISMHYEFN